MTPDPMVLRVTSLRDRSTVCKQAVAGLETGHRVNVFAPEETATALLFSVRAIGTRIFIYGVRGTALFENPASAVRAGLSWLDPERVPA